MWNKYVIYIRKKKCFEILILYYKINVFSGRIWFVIGIFFLKFYFWRVEGRYVLGILYIFVVYIN